MEKSLITSGQRNLLVQVVTDATRKRMEQIIDKLVVEGDVNTGNCQRIIAQGDKIVTAVASAARGKIVELAGGSTKYLRRVLSDRKFVIGATNGEINFSNWKDVISCRDRGIEEDLYKNVAEEPTDETVVHIFNLFGRAKFSEMFGSFGENLDRICFTKHQIRLFANNYHDIFNTGGTFFLLKQKNDFAIVEAISYVSGQSEVKIYALSHSYEWWGDLHSYCLVVPRL
jgi:hypothetical protein